MNDLYIWREGGTIYEKRKGVPRSIKCMLRDLPNKNPGEWTMYNPFRDSFPPNEETKLPKFLYLEIEGNVSIEFDYLHLAHYTIVVSEKMLNFLQKFDLSAHEVAEIKQVLKRSGKSIETDKKYYAMRFCRFDDDCIDCKDEKVCSPFSKKILLFPKMCIKPNVKKEIFVTLDISVAYMNSLLFNERVKKLIEENNFIGPPIYSMEEYAKAY